MGHAVDDASLYPGGDHETPDWSAVPIGPPWDEAELPGVPAIVVEPTSFAAGYRLRQEYRNRSDTTAVFPTEVLVELNRLLGDVRDLVGVIALITQVLVLAAVLLAMIAALAQRRRQLAILRALGASRAYVFATVWFGAATVLALGAALGLAFGYAAALVLARLVEARTGVAMPVALAGQELALVLVTVLIGLLAATIPAILAYRGPVAAGLRA